MLKFFRRIRRKLIGEGNLKRYLFYAIGEIALVVIGILIALQINNWNEWKKERIKEREVLIDLVENLETNIRTLESNIEDLNLFDRSSEIVLSNLYNNRPYVDTLQSYFHLARIPKREIFLSRTGYEGYKDIGLHILTNNDLKDEVLTLFETIYPSTLSNYKMVNRYMPEFEDHIVQNFIYSNQKLEPIDYRKLLTDHYYISWIRAFKEGRKDLIRMESNLIKETERVLHLIKDELK